MQVGDGLADVDLEVLAACSLHHLAGQEDETDVELHTQFAAQPFKSIEKNAVTSGQYSFEERMGCGFGACMGCSCKTKYGNKRICKDGPVLEKEEIIW